MRLKLTDKLKLGIGIVFSLFFLYLVFRKVDLTQLLESLRDANLATILFAIFILFLSHWFRAVRHRYLLKPIKPISDISLFSALMIGYMANTVLPAHLGEFLRAFAIGKKERIPSSSVFASIVVERVVDILTLILLMGLVFTMYPLPELMKFSAYLTFAFAIGIVGILALIKQKPKTAFGLIGIITKALPKRIEEKILNMTHSFREGLVGLENGRSYIIFIILSLVIVGCYICVLAIGFNALNLMASYNLPIGASLVVLVMTAIAVAVPSSPGYFGTYHWLCVLALGLFGVPESPAFAYAIIMHGISVIPVSLVGLVFALKEGISISKIENQFEPDPISLQS